MAGHYGFEPIDTTPFAYPANVLIAQLDARNKIKAKGRFRNVLVIERDRGGVAIEVSETLDIGNTLFYIPVIPLYLWHNYRKNRKTAELLLSVCTYLYRHAIVPYYRNERSYYTYPDNQKQQ